jgi:hypothetical protein
MTPTLAGISGDPKKVDCRLLLDVVGL